MNLNHPLIHAPGASRLRTYNMLAYGRQIRDEWIWQLPLLHAAAYTYQQMCAGREIKVSGTPRGVAGAIEWFNNAVTYTYDGMVNYGFEDFEKRRALDHIAVGRRLFYAPMDGPLEYLDPTEVFFDRQNREWYSSLTARRFPEADVHVDHAIPLGGSGLFVAPLAGVIPMGMLAWLVRDHDKASLDGRRLRDIILVRGSELADLIASSIKQYILEYTEPNPEKNNVAVVYFNETSGTPMPAQDMVGRLGIAEIPNGFDRKTFEISYANEIGGGLGLALRHFYNIEQATNRALEEVQEARQQQKGPSAYVRSEQRIFRRPQLMRRFGRKTRASFIEEVDIQSRKVNAEVLALYSQAAKTINEIAPGRISLDALFGWLQGDDVLPADVNILNPPGVTEPGIDLDKQDNPDKLSTPNEKEGIQQRNLDKSLGDELDYGEVTMTLDGKIIEQRHKVFSIEKAMALEIASNVEEIEAIQAVQRLESLKTFADVLEQSANANLELLKDLDDAAFNNLIAEYPEDQQGLLTKLRQGEAVNMETLTTSVADVLIRGMLSNEKSTGA